nr:conserved hypothetical protein [uncultured archaeon]
MQLRECFSLFIFLFIRKYLKLAIQRNKMTTTEEILCRIEKGGTLDVLANEFGMRKLVLLARIEFMVRAGYLSEIHSEKGQGCAGCPMSGTCSVPVPEGSGKVKMYVLTEKGMECIQGAKNNGVIR